MKTITGLLVDPKKNICKTVTIEKSLDSYYKTLDCDTIDIVSRRIDNIIVDVICDDEALLKDTPIPSAFDSDTRPMLCNAILLVKFDGVDDVCSLPEPDIERIRKHIRIYWSADLMTVFPAIYGMSY